MSGFFLNVPSSSQPYACCLYRSSLVELLWWSRRKVGGRGKNRATYQKGKKGGCPLFLFSDVSVSLAGHLFSFGVGLVPPFYSIFSLLPCLTFSPSYFAPDHTVPLLKDREKKVEKRQASAVLCFWSPKGRRAREMLSLSQFERLLRFLQWKMLSLN